MGNAGRFIIDRLKKEHCESYLNHFSAVVMQSLKVHSLESERQYLEHQLWAQKKGYTHFYCLLEPSNLEVMGGIEIRNPLQFPGQLYCWLNESYWGKGLLQESMSLVAKDYFMLTNAESFNAHVDVHNQRSYKALKKCGFADAGMFDGPWGLQFILSLHSRIFYPSKAA